MDSVTTLSFRLGIIEERFDFLFTDSLSDFGLDRGVDPTVDDRAAHKRDGGAAHAAQGYEEAQARAPHH